VGHLQQSIGYVFFPSIYISFVVVLLAAIATQLRNCKRTNINLLFIAFMISREESARSGFALYYGCTYFMPFQIRSRVLSCDIEASLSVR